jgi:hypothetical protein
VEVLYASLGIIKTSEFMFCQILILIRSSIFYCFQSYLDEFQGIDFTIHSFDSTLIFIFLKVCFGNLFTSVPFLWCIELQNLDLVCKMNV